MLLLAVVAGCAPETGVAVPGEQATTTTAPADPTTPRQTPKSEFPDAPPNITAGPVVRQGWERPCELLDDATAKRIGIAGDADPGPGTNIRASCKRKADGERMEFELFSRFSMFYDPYLDTWEYYAEADVHGLPAGVFSEQAQPTEMCAVAVAINETASVSVDLRTAQGDPEVCGRALAVAAHVVGEVIG
ncbi:DUF3558 family protein [Actinokineospora guangxiensis]|uniref:DUF3558 family protein n=1 Tax=Actinokineospora guangxiensis TaxID=1490288 RepID=A0ABW0EPD8_9PSEU